MTIREAKPKQASVLLVDDEPGFLEALHAALASEQLEVETAGDGIQAINLLQKRGFDLVVLDVRMPRVDGIEVLQYVKDNTPDTEVIMLTGVQEISIAVDCMHRGAFTYLSKPVNAKEFLTVAHNALDKRTLAVENKVLRARVGADADKDAIVGGSPSLMELLTIAAKVAPTDSPVLVQGASGTGKELVARYIHDRSLRTDRPFVSVNCAAIPETLMESELFGHMKGAFTDAKATKTGLVDLANMGTLFLDEVGELSLSIQPKLLRFLQFGEYRRVGGNEPLHADVRVVSATNRDLQEEVRKGSFREDLLYRINVMTLEIAPLRKRTEDIPVLVEHFLARKSRPGPSISIDPRALDILFGYSWPGNVRELENVIERACILCENNVIRSSNIMLSGRGMAPGESAGMESPIGTAVSIQEIEKLHIDAVLKSVRWNKKVAAEILGISLKTLYTKIQQYQLKQAEA